MKKMMMEEDPNERMKKITITPRGQGRFPFWKGIAFIFFSALACG
jgi:hypothetical protein